MRQTRVKYEDCQRKDLAQSKKCSSSIKDSENYMPRWQNYKNFSYSRNYWRIVAPWTYKSNFDLSTTFMNAAERWYFGDGYTVQLGRNYNNSRRIIDFLRTNNWIDSGTSNIVIELTIYNIDSNIFNVIHLNFERNLVGLFQTTHQIQSCKFLFNFSSMTATFIVVFAIFIFLTLWFFLREILKISRLGLWMYLKDIWNVADMIIICLSVSVVALFMQRNNYVEALLQRIETTQNNDFVSFNFAAILDSAISYLAGILICVSTIRLWKVLLFAQKFRLFTNTLYNASSALMSCTLLTAIFLIGYCGCVFLVNGSESEIFHNLKTVIPAITAVSFGFEPFDLQNLMYGGKIFGIIILFIMILVVTLFLMNMFMTIIIFNFDKSKEEERHTKRLYTIVDYAKDKTDLWKIELKKIFRKKIKKSEEEEVRLKGGGTEKTSLLRSSKAVETIDAQFTFLEEYFKNLEPKKKIKMYKSIKALQDCSAINDCK